MGMTWMPFSLACLMMAFISPSESIVPAVPLLLLYVLFPLCTADLTFYVVPFTVTDISSSRKRRPSLPKANCRCVK